MNNQKEIKVGAIIEYDDKIKAVVMDKCNDELYVYNENACVETVNIKDIKDTGKNIYIDELLNEIREA